MLTVAKNLLIGTALMVSASAVQAEQVLDYKISLSEDSQSYQIFMKPTQTPFADLNLTAQVTLKVPHLDGSLGFKAENIQSHIDGILWVETSRIDAPKEAPFFDYISFSLLASDTQALRRFNWQADTEKLMFSFNNLGGCINDVTIMADDDVFSQQPNSANTNPSNQFTNLGWGSVSENNYRQNYGDKIHCSSVPQEKK